MLPEGTWGGVLMGAESWVTSKVHQRIDTLRYVFLNGLSQDLCESPRFDRSNRLGFTVGKKEIRTSFSPEAEHMDFILRKQLLLCDISLYLQIPAAHVSALVPVNSTLSE